jgi:hypothetical protein
MTLTELLDTTTAAGIRLEAQGDRLHVEAPAGIVTANLRDELARHKPALLTLLRPVTEYVTLKNGPTLPAGVIRLAIDLEARGFTMALDADQQFTIEPATRLTDEDRAAIARWRLHLGAVIGYQAPEVA